MPRRWKIKIGEQVSTDASCSAIISNQIPQKLKILVSFTIPIEIGDIHFSKDLCDLRANINLIPLSIYEKLIFDKNTHITLLL